MESVDDESVRMKWATEINEIMWLPICHTFVDDMLPPKDVEHKDTVSRDLILVGAPKSTRPKSDMWLCSSEMLLLDGFGVESEELLRTFGWDKPVDSVVCAYQLCSLSCAFYSEAGKNTPSFRQTLATVIPKIYSQIEAELIVGGGEGEGDDVDVDVDIDVDVDSDKVDKVKKILNKQQWIFVGDSFVAAERMAFRAVRNSRPHLFQVPAELVCFSKILKMFGVREKFSGEDYVSVLSDLMVSYNGESLKKDDLDLAVSMAKMLGAMGEKEWTGIDKTSICLPSDSRLMKKASDMVYNDAAWLSRSLKTGT